MSSGGVAGGDKSNVKVVPFGTKPVVASDYSHIKDFTTMNFAMELGKSKPDPRKKGEEAADEDDAGESWDDEDGEGASKARKKTGKKQTLVDPEDLQAFLQNEGVDPQGENLCPLPKCMEVISKIILNDKNAKIERAEIMVDIEAMNALLAESLREEEKAQQQLVTLAKEQQGLEHTVEQQKEKVKNLEQKKEDLEVEKKTFNGKMGVLERDERNWGAKLKAAQAKFAKIAWLKPGQKYDDNEGHLQMDIHTIRASTAKDLDDISVPATVDYNRLAGGGIRDYNERPLGPLYYSRYVEDAMTANVELMSVATTSKLAFLQKKKKIKKVTSSNTAAAFHDAAAGGNINPGMGVSEHKEGEGDTASVASALTMGGRSLYSTGSGGGRSSPFIKPRPEAQTVKNVREYLISAASRRMIKSPEKGLRRSMGGGLGLPSTAPALGAPAAGLSSQSVGPGIGIKAVTSLNNNNNHDSSAIGGAGGGGGVVVAATGLLDRSTLERMSLVSSSMSRSGNKNPASVIGSPVRALQALRNANATAAVTSTGRGGLRRSPSRSPSPPLGRRQVGEAGGRGGHGYVDDDMKSVNTMSTLGADASVFSLDEQQAIQYEDGSFFVQRQENFEGGGAVGGSLVTSNRNYGKRKDHGRIRTITDGVGTLNYKPRTVKDMLEATEFN